jgi:hypothetical protein
LRELDKQGKLAHGGSYPTKRPVKCEDVHLVFLDNLRESGVTNMFGATPYVETAFPELNKTEAKNILLYWMKSFGKER